MIAPSLRIVTTTTFHCSSQPATRHNDDLLLRRFIQCEEDVPNVQSSVQASCCCCYSHFNVIRPPVRPSVCLFYSACRSTHLMMKWWFIHPYSHHYSCGRVCVCSCSSTFAISCLVLAKEFAMWQWWPWAAPTNQWTQPLSLSYPSSYHPRPHRPLACRCLGVFESVICSLRRRRLSYCCIVPAAAAAAFKTLPAAHRLEAQLD